MKRSCRLTLSLVIVLLTSLFIYLSPPASKASIDPRHTPNNRFGIHITDASDIQAAADLVNSNGGEWGYVTLVIREDNQDVKEWQDFFDQLRQHKLIPLVRIATRMNTTNWSKPSVDSAREWAEFLDQLNWVVKNRYVILFNEPNHAKEWGGQINPAEYAQVVEAFETELRKRSADFFILPAGMDDAAPNSAFTMNSANYFQGMYKADDQVFKRFDGWTSHAYPNPNFAGRPQDVGPGTIAGFRSELNLVRQFGFDHTKPVFITETGWQHLEGETDNRSLPSSTQVADYFTYAYQNVWNDPQVVAVTPFILKYHHQPFDHFSWAIPDSDDFYPQYETVRNLPKIAGRPEQVHHAQFIHHRAPKELLRNERYSYAITFKNTGQSIWDPSTTRLKIDTNLPMGTVIVDSLPRTLPYQEATVFVHVQTSVEEADYYVELTPMYMDEPFDQAVTQSFSIVAQDDVVAKIKLWLHKIKYPGEFLHAYTVPRNQYSLREDETEDT